MALEYYPEKELQFLNFDEETKRIERMGREFRIAKVTGMTDEEAFCYALGETHSHLISHLRHLAPEELYRRIKNEFVKPAGIMLKMIIEMRFWPFRTRLNRHFSERLALDPAQLLLAATDRPTAHPSGIPYRLCFEDRRRLAIALQLYAIELTDPDDWASSDLLCVDELSFDRLFIRGEDKILWVVAKLGRKNQCLKKTLRVFEQAAAARRYERKLNERNGGKVFVDRHLCRVVRTSRRTYYVWVDERYKEQDSILLKLERGRWLLDRRGWRYVVVGVETKSGLRIASRQDAKRFCNLTVDRLWHEPLVFGDIKKERNPYSHPDYRDEKVRGRFCAWHTTEDGRRFLVKAPCEQLVLDIEIHINTETSLLGDNHKRYKTIETIAALGPVWFPYPVYLIDWPEFPASGHENDRRQIVADAINHWLDGAIAASF